ncbi:hypothetical protein Pmar_PMAR008887 [Perkinsus marinus ATCC 50983]|uniref:Uncharacterized protein n=1 Tax=Perkinsus marinus (strain ATCC 50983 / TXsc) TaxID=423536 RepID=C5KA97_PERM5|nr:hypothetical protein Pmar_PMAR008887 [Perkinsus marinus ATCC 50983]EER18558.1 hypothetical protein Pmar_PMAR008887 [Perkinsus marinus ATCC 50983]|eukprot:XP_002786762.1 hypothetical protein Pmar_PMAR008887 [Perkinsus marinus ATCC 50983]
MAEIRLLAQENVIKANFYIVDAHLLPVNFDLLIGQKTLHDLGYRLVNVDENKDDSDQTWVDYLAHQGELLAAHEDLEGIIRARALLPDCIWSFQGRLMYKCSKESLWFSDWRPHPNQLLAEKELESIRKDYKQYIAQYEAGGRDFASQQRAAAVADRKAIPNDFRSMVKDLKEFRAEMRKSLAREDWEEGFKRLAPSREIVTFTETRDIEQGKPKEELYSF